MQTREIATLRRMRPTNTMKTCSTKDEIEPLEQFVFDEVPNMASAYGRWLDDRTVGTCYSNAYFTLDRIVAFRSGDVSKGSRERRSVNCARKSVPAERSSSSTDSRTSAWDEFTVLGWRLARCISIAAPPNGRYVSNRRPR